MKKTQYIILAAFAMIVSAMLASCESDYDHNGGGEEPEAPAPRTLLVYMVANNSLGSGNNDMSDLREMQQAASEGVLGNNRLLVYHSQYNSASPVLKEVLSDGTIDTLKTYDAGTLSVTKKQMRQVFADVKEFAPADDYGLVLWSHALGWTQDGVTEVEETRQYSRSAVNYSFGQDNGQKMNVTALAQALDGAGFSFVYFDCCYMGTVEVAYEMRNVTPYIIAGPTETPLDGMPYQLNLKYLLASEADLIGAAQSTYEYNTVGYTIYSCPVSIAVYDTSKIDELASLTAQIYDVASTPYPDGYTPQRYSSTKPTDSYFFDWQHYVRAICDDDDLYSAWEAALHDVVLYSECTESIWGKYAVETSCGLSTYIMKTYADASTAGYNQLQWYADIASRLVE